MLSAEPPPHHSPAAAPSASCTLSASQPPNEAANCPLHSTQGYALLSAEPAPPTPPHPAPHLGVHLPPTCSSAKCFLYSVGTAPNAAANCPALTYTPPLARHTSVSLCTHRVGLTGAYGFKSAHSQLIYHTRAEHQTCGSQHHTACCCCCVGGGATMHSSPPACLQIPWHCMLVCLYVGRTSLHPVVTTGVSLCVCQLHLPMRCHTVTSCRAQRLLP